MKNLKLISIAFLLVLICSSVVSQNNTNKEKPSLKTAWIAWCTFASVRAAHVFFPSQLFAQLPATQWLVANDAQMTRNINRFDDSIVLRSRDLLLVNVVFFILIVSSIPILIYNIFYCVGRGTK